MTTNHTHREDHAMSRPSARQVDMLRRAAETHQVYNIVGFGPLGVDLRTYDALLRKGWITEVPVSRGHGFGQGILAQITDAGREALAAV